MKKDIEFPKVEGVKLAIAKKESEFDTNNAPDNVEWAVYCINTNEFVIRNVLITSRGYGGEGDERKTSTLRHMIDAIKPHQSEVIEPIDPSVFDLFNEYWISYYVNDVIYDKKFVFPPFSTTETLLSDIKILHLKGILHE